MAQELARKLPAIIVKRAPTVIDGSVVTVKRTPADWPWYVWAPILCTPGVVMAYVLVMLANFIFHAL